MYRQAQLLGWLLVAVFPFAVAGGILRVCQTAAKVNTASSGPPSCC